MHAKCIFQFFTFYLIPLQSNGRLTLNYIILCQRFINSFVGQVDVREVRLILKFTGPAVWLIYFLVLQTDSRVQFCSTVWDQPIAQDSQRVEAVQRRAASFSCRQYLLHTQPEYNDCKSGVPDTRRVTKACHHKAPQRLGK